MKIKTFSILLACISPFIALAQTGNSPSSGQNFTVCWEVKPIYHMITPFAKSLYKATIQNKMYIIGNDGDILLKADSITNITNGYALALTKTNGKYRIENIIDSLGKTTEINFECYSTDKSYFSEGKCIISNDSKFGYINSDGELPIPFKYTNVHPFRNGHAYVSTSLNDNSKTIEDLLKKKGNDRKDIYQNNQSKENYREPIIAKSFNQHETIINMKQGEFFQIDHQGNITKVVSEQIFMLDEYFANHERESEKINIPYKPNYNSKCSIFNNKGLKGYMYSGSVIVPAQFEKAYGFSSNHAVVKKDGQYGILRLIHGPLKVSVIEQNRSLKVNCYIPSDMDENIFYFTRTTTNGKHNFQMEGWGNTFSLDTNIIDIAESKIYEVLADGLVIWKQSKATKIKTKIRKNNTQPSKKAKETQNNKNTNSPKKSDSSTTKTVPSIIL